MTALLEINLNQPIESFSEKLLYGGQMLLIGMGTVFAVLILLWACLSVFKIVFHDLPAKRTSPDATTPKAVVDVPSGNAALPTWGSDDEIVAVIAAAIAAAESESSGLKFKVVSFRRK